MRRSTIDHLTAEQVRCQGCLLPPLGEQKEIARYLENVSIKLERLTEEAQAAMMLAAGAPLRPDLRRRHRQDRRPRLATAGRLISFH
ncbi:hypothetical protein [Halomonas sp.]|uniref:hypothetical protein n=1 Tax=Halomonas sp. TaxID=1486246 RepID=UPI003A0FEAF0